jgi:hypothetical protein
MSETPGTDAKAPARSAGEILADIERERSELSRSFETLRSDLDESLDAGRQRARDAGKKAAVIGPIAAGVVASAAAALLLLRRRSRKEE